MIVADIKDDIKQVLGFCEDSTIYNRLSKAIEVLANEAQWDAMQAYMDIIVVNNLITLPRDVEVPIKLNINNRAAFSRSKLYEFTINGPGSDMADAGGFSWMDKGTVPVVIQPNNSFVAARCYDTADIGQKLVIYGVDQNGRECSDILTCTHISVAPENSVNIYKVISKVAKPLTVGRVELAALDATDIIPNPPLPPPPNPPPPPSPPPPTETQVPNPTLQPVPGSYTVVDLTMRVTVNIDQRLHTIPGLKISVTKDGSDPSPTNGTITSGGLATVLLGIGDTTLRVMGFAPGYLNSDIIGGVYHITSNREEPEGGGPRLAAGDEPGHDIIFLPPPEYNQYYTLAEYYSNETEPAYRQILLNRAANAKIVRMLYRRKTYKVSSDQDWIPLDSEMALITMVRALEIIRDKSNEDMQLAEPLYQKAVYFAKQEQTSRNNFDIAAQSESPSTLDLGYNNADSIIVADIIDDAAAIFGPIGRENLYDKITDAVELLNDKAQWDGLVGYVDLLTDNHYYVTLPRYVEAPISINVNGSPKMMRNKWFEFHLNGPGSRMPACKYWDDVGDVVTLRPLPVPMQLIARNELQIDDGRIVTIYGYDKDGRALRTQRNGVWADGLDLTTSLLGKEPQASDIFVGRIERIVKEPSSGFIQLVAWEPITKSTVPVGYFHPDETEPNYHRIKLPSRCAWVRMKYRKRQLKVTGLTDPIHLRKKLAVVTAMRSIKAMMDGKIQDAQAYEDKAEKYLIEEQVSRNPSETFTLQVSGIEPSEVII